MVNVFPKTWKGGKNEIHEAVQIGHIHSQGLYYGLSAQESERPNQTAFHDIRKRMLRMLELGMKIGVAGLFSSLLCLQVEKFWGICLTEEKKARYLNGAVSNRSCPEDPAPSCALGYKAASNWPNSRTEKGRQAVYTYCFATLFCAPAIAEDTSAELQGVSGNHLTITNYLNVPPEAQILQVQKEIGTQSSPLYSC